MELRYSEVDRARSIYERYIQCIPTVKAWVRYAKFEMQNGEVALARGCYERAVEELAEDGETVSPVQIVFVVSQGSLIGHEPQCHSLALTLSPKHFDKKLLGAQRAVKHERCKPMVKVHGFPHTSRKACTSTRPGSLFRERPTVPGHKVYL